jgi:site-specific recombinase XerD
MTNTLGFDWRSEFKRLEDAYAPATMRSYRSDVEAFETWCDTSGLAPFPATVDTVCRFLEEQGREKAPSTVRRRLYAIRKAHRLLRLPDPTHDEEINLALRRVKRARGIRSKQTRGMTRAFLERFVDCQPATPWGRLRNRAMLTLGYELLARRSELVALRNEDVTWRGDGTLRVLIRRSKSDHYAEGRIAFTSRATADLVTAWMDWRGPAIPWLFCPIYHGKAINRDLSTTTVKRLIKSAATSAGLELEAINAFSGHSMRFGAAQDLLTMGHDTAAIMRAGGWKSVNVLGRYLEQAEHNVWA